MKVTTVYIFLVRILVAVYSASSCPHSSFVITTSSTRIRPGSLLGTESVPSLDRCINLCSIDALCAAFMYHMENCLLLSSISIQEKSGEEEGDVTGVIGEKRCLKGCGRLWAAEIFSNSELPISSKHVVRTNTREDCIQLCISNKQFNCRGANYYSERNECALSSVDRFAVSEEMQLRSEKTGVDYIESNCGQAMRGMCHFTEASGVPLVSPDVLHEHVETLQQCRDLCLTSTLINCRSYDFSENGLCRLSHSYGSAVELRSRESQLGVTSYHLTSCYNVSVYCGSNSMTAKITSNKLFRGKVYDKSRPNSCVSDVSSDTDFQLELGFNDLECEVSQETSGKFSSNIIIQHHDQIVTEQDLGLSIKCSYSLANRSVQHGVNLDVKGEPAMMGTHESSFVLSPTVTMHITDRSGEDIHTAQVGDPLSLRFQIADRNTPYEIFVRELIAFDGVDSSEILLIDSKGCPTDPTIMGAINTVTREGETQSLEAPFDAFKFPTSDVVQFKALVTPCLPTCEPVTCSMEDYFGNTKQVASFGRRKRELRSRVDEEVVMQTIKIQDKFKFTQKTPNYPIAPDLVSEGRECSSSGSIAFFLSLVMSAQFIFCLVCYTTHQKWKQTLLEDKL